MTKQHHTPGPWHIGGNGSASAHGVTRVWATDRAAVCIIATRQQMGANTSPEMDANARLIAAAPDLLEALERFAYECRAAASMDHGLSQADCLRIAKHAKAIIARAKGER